MFKYKKLRKLFLNPKLFFIDYFKKRFLKKKDLKNFIIEKTNYILIYAPIDTSGLNRQLLDIIEILEINSISFMISWHSKPKISSELLSHWIDYEESKKISPNLIINLERYNNAHKFKNNIFYINLDWLSKKDFLFSKIYCDMILYPNKYKINLFKKTYFNQYFNQLNWISKSTSEYINVQPSNHIINNTKIDQVVDTDIPEKKIRILFFAKQIYEHRSNAQLVINAFKNYKKKNLLLTIKTSDNNFFLTNPNITVINEYLDDRQLNELYKSHDIVLIPNSCEGNGLLIFEAIQCGCIPVVIDGYPMKTLVNEQYAYLLPFLGWKRQKYAKYYQINSSIILNFFNELNYEEVVKKQKYLNENYKFITKNRQKNIFTEKFEGILDYYDQLDQHFHYKTKVRISSTKEREKIVQKRKSIIDVFVSSYNRFDFFKECIHSLNQAIDISSHSIKVHIFLDGLKDQRYLEIIKKNKFNYYIYNERLGLPYILRHIKFILKNNSERLLHKSKFFCYLQDDCTINNSINYFDDMVNITYNSIRQSDLNFVTGFYNQIHPGYYDFTTIDQKNCRLSKSIDGKNIFGLTNTLLRIPDFSFFKDNYKKQGNPGPATGSNFDLWLWRDNPLTKSRTNVIYKNAILLQSKSKMSDFSSWKNSESEESIEQRVKQNKTYK